MNEAEQRVFAALRQADAPWLEMWELAKLAGYGSKRTTRAVADLRRRGLVVRRPSSGLSMTEVSLVSGGVW